MLEPATTAEELDSFDFGKLITVEMVWTVRKASNMNGENNVHALQVSFLAVRTLRLVAIFRHGQIFEVTPDSAIQVSTGRG